MAKEMERAKATKAKAVNKPKELKWKVGKVLECKISPISTRDVLKGEMIDEYNLYKKQTLNNSKGLEVGTVEHMGLTRLVNDPITGKIFLTGKVTSTHKITKNGKQYIADTVQDMDHEVDIDKTAMTAKLVGEPVFTSLRISSLTRDDMSLTALVSKSPTIYDPWWRIFHPSYHPIYSPIYNPFKWPSWYPKPSPVPNYIYQPQLNFRWINGKFTWL